MTTAPSWLATWMKDHRIDVWGVADLTQFAIPTDVQGRFFGRGIVWATAMHPRIMAAIQSGPNQAYADEYARVNARINACAQQLITEISQHGFEARALAASERTDPVAIKGDFPHKTAATLAGLGWVGRHCQLITRKFGSWVRLGTVFTDWHLPPGKPLRRSFCGTCQRCVDACPAKALTGNTWYAGCAREEILDVHACDHWKKKHYRQYHGGHNCGICSAVCPYGQKVLKDEKRRISVVPAGH